MGSILSNGKRDREVLCDRRLCSATIDDSGASQAGIKSGAISQSVQLRLVQSASDIPIAGHDPIPESESGMKNFKRKPYEGNPHVRFERKMLVRPQG